MSYGSKDVPLIRKVSEVLAVVSKAMLQRKKITSKVTDIRRQFSSSFLCAQYSLSLALYYN